MKKLILSAIILSAATVTVNAQANSILLYGNAGYHSNKDFSGDKTRAYNFNLGLGYQFDQHWTTGVYGSFGSDRILVYSPTNNKEFWNFRNTYEAGAFLRHTIGLGKIFAVFNQLNAGYIGSTSGVTDNNGSNFTANGFHANLTPYVGVNVYKGFALNFSFGGLDYKTQSGHGATSNSFDVTFGSQFSVGVSKNFACYSRKHHAKHNNNNNDTEETMMKDKDE